MAFAGRAKVRWDLVRDTKRQDAGSESQKSRPATAPFLRLNSSKDSVRAPREKEKRILRTGSAKNVASGPLGWSSTGRLKDTFFQFTNGEMEMNMSMFLKFCRDCKRHRLSQDLIPAVLGRHLALFAETRRAFGVAGANNHGVRGVKSNGDCSCCKQTS
eukprot:160621-Rhodomonas_salina.4